LAWHETCVGILLMFNASWPVHWSVVALVGSAVVLIFAGTKLVRVADRLADRTGMGKALAGAIFLGATTSLPGIVTTGVAAAAGNADLAVSNALGSIAAQTTYVAIADLTYPKANLEHAAASLPNLLQSIVLMGLVGLVLVGAASPGLAIGRMHPVSFLLPVAYIGSLYLTLQTRRAPMWRPEETKETRHERPDPDAQRASLSTLLFRFAALGLLVAGSGYAIAVAGLSLAEETGLSGSFVGGALTSVITSLPELVTVVAAVRAGSLALAVGDIIGGNTFDVLFVVVADAAFAAGPVYSAIADPTLFLLGLTIVLTGLLAAGLVYRDKGGIGFEGLSMLILYLIGMLVLYFGGAHPS